MVTNQRWQTRARSGAVAPRLYLVGRHFDMYSFESQRINIKMRPISTDVARSVVCVFVCWAHRRAL